MITGAGSKSSLSGDNEGLRINVASTTNNVALSLIQFGLLSIISYCYMSITLWHNSCTFYYEDTIKRKRYTIVMTPKLEIVLEELRILRAKSAEMEDLYRKTLVQEATQNMQKKYFKR